MQPPPPSSSPYFRSADMAHSPSMRDDQYLTQFQQQHDRLPTSDAYLDIPGPSSRRPSDGGTSGGSSDSHGRYFSADEDRPERRLPDGLRAGNGEFSSPAPQNPPPPMGLRSPYQPHSFTTSPSANSFSSPTRGKRAPAPAALDLSSDGFGQRATDQHGRARNLVGLGYGPPPGARDAAGDDRRIVTDPSFERRISSRPLPHPPQESREISYTYDTAGNSGPPEQLRTPHGSIVSGRTVSDTYIPPRSFTSPFLPNTALPPALGSTAFSPRLSSLPQQVKDEGALPPNISPPSQSYTPHIGPETALLRPSEIPAASTSPQLDPSTVDRSGLQGIGELATPRWAASSGGHFLRTPLMPPLPSPLDGSHAGPLTGGTQSAWSRSSFAHGNRERSEPGGSHQRFHSISAPSHAFDLPTLRANSQQTPDSQAQSGEADAELAKLLEFAHFADTGFESNIPTALAASLATPDERPPIPSLSPPIMREDMPGPSRPAPTIATYQFSSQPSFRPYIQNEASGQSSVSQHSPNTARARLAARRQEREVAAQRASRQLSVDPHARAPAIPLRTASQFSPPTSVDVAMYGGRSPREPRKTPPTKPHELPRAKQSPGSAQDIIRHFAPRDFSHLPPSPSSASINQFLRGSASTQNVASKLSTPPEMVGQPRGASYFSLQNSTEQPKANVARSDSARHSLQHTSNLGYQERDLDAGTAEALRKLDGLSTTPGKKGSGRGRIATEPIAGKSGMSSLSGGEARSTAKQGEEASSLQAWVELGTDIPGETAKASKEKRESSSSTSFVGTPTSRESSVPPRSTAPSSVSAMKNGGRASVSSDVSSKGDVSDETLETTGIKSVPPVPPIPKGYASMRQGLSGAAGSPGGLSVPSAHNTPPPATFSPTAYVPLQGPAESVSPLAETTSPGSSPPAQPGEGRPKVPSKKWSFSSALGFKSSKPSVSPNDSPVLNEVEESSQPPTPWLEVSKDDLPIPPRTNRLYSTDTSLSYGSSEGSGGAGPAAPFNRSQQSITPVALAAASSNVSGKSGSSGNKRYTPSGIPFFRRTSSSSVSTKVTAHDQLPQTPMNTVSPDPSRPTPNTGTRRSYLGISMPSMLRGSSSKRGISQQLSAPPVEAEEKVQPKQVQSASLPWSGRKRGNTLSMQDGPQLDLRSAPPETEQRGTLRHQPSSDSTIEQDSIHSYRTDSTVNAPSTARQRTALPSIAGSPAIKPSASQVHLKQGRDGASATPTKITRAAQRGSPSRGLMPPPSTTISASRSSNNINPTHVSSKSVSGSHSMSGLNGMAVGEFGSVNGGSSMSPPAAPTHPAHTRHATIDSHRSHLLAPMSSRQPKKGDKVRDPLVRTMDSGQVIPPSRRHMPLPSSKPVAPSSTVTAMTISALNKRRVSNENRPGVSRRSSKDTTSGQETSSGAASPIKPSKSMHGALNLPSTAKMANSSSVGAPGVGFRKASLLADSHSTSPADDEEALGDAEMRAYVERRKARRKNGSGKKDDLSDIADFPEDTQPAEPLSQRAFVTRNLATMSDYERREVLDFDWIWFTPSKRIVRTAPDGGPTTNHGYDDDRGDYLIAEGDHLCYRYEIISILGKGSFGQVLQCRDHRTGQSVAVKIIRNKKRFHAQALVEIKILAQLCEWDPEDDHYMVRMTDHFNFRGHLCIVTELLSINLYELIKANSFAGFSTTLIRRFTTQMLGSLQLMRSHRIVHCDLKPENILLCHPCKSGIKVIDFGSSCLETEKVYTYIQSRFYRSPEVILGMNYTMSIDMWSLGCILAELYTGMPLFPGENEQEQLACIMEVLGVPDKTMVEKASRRKIFFDATGNPRPFVNAKGKRRRPNTRTLARALKSDDELFVDFIGKCLIWDPERRMKPQAAMRHPWILAGRRRAPQPPATSSSNANRESRSSVISAASSTLRSSKQGGDKNARNSKELYISGPTPLTARRKDSSGSGSGSTTYRSQGSGPTTHPSNGQLRHSSLLSQG